MTNLRDRKKFFINFLKNWKQIGSITPSSNFLSRKMLKGLDISGAKMIVELGAGTGSITKHIIQA